MSQAKLYDEKTALVYQVETLKDQLEDSQQTNYQLKQSAQRQQSVSGTLSFSFSLPLVLPVLYLVCVGSY